MDIIFVFHGLKNLRSREFVTTDTELIAIARPANSGLSIIPNFINTPAASGIPKMLYKNANIIFCLILFTVCLLSDIAFITSSRLFLISIIHQDSNATSVQFHIAIHKSACISAGASFIPSPTIATIFHSDCNCLIFSDFSHGNT
ncbi:MAG: hypothetical protein WCG25_08245 [bacterium]